MNQFRFARHSLVALTSGVAAVTFVISFHGLNGYGVRLMHLGALSPFVPAGVDMASLVALISGHLRRGERLRRRAYAWLVFICTALLSVAGNLADGYARHLPTAGLVGVACAPVVFALVSHLAITSWRTGTDPASHHPLADTPAGQAAPGTAGVGTEPDTALVTAPPGSPAAASGRPADSTAPAHPAERSSSGGGALPSPADPASGADTGPAPRGRSAKSAAARRTPARASAPTSARRKPPAAPAPDVSDLVPAGRAVRDRLATDGRAMTRDELVTGLRADGHTVSSRRASALYAALNHELPPGTADRTRANGHTPVAGADLTEGATTS